MESQSAYMVLGRVASCAHGLSNRQRIKCPAVQRHVGVSVNVAIQGGVLSPVLFCLYIDGLLVALSRAGVGCFIGSNFVGALAYSDDIVLLARTVCYGFT